jgi:hypothetical protein
MVARPPGVKIVPGSRIGKLLADPVLVPAHVGRDERVARDRRAHVGEDALGAHREGVALGVLAVALDERLAHRPDLARQREALDPLGTSARATRHQGGQRLLQVRDGADLGRIVAADLGRVDVDVDELRRREVERVLLLPRAAVGLREARAQARAPGRRRGIAR